MLVITRKIGEKLVIEGPATVTLIGVKSMTQVRLGVDADDDVAVLRDESPAEVKAELRRRCGGKRR